MIGRLRGILAATYAPNVALIDVGGVGYEVELPISSFALLPPLGKEVTLAIHHVVREDASLLYGFSDEREREAFRILIKVSGIGPKSAIGILSGLNASELREVILTEDMARLTKVPGIGKKSGERLILELRDKVDLLKVSGVEEEGTDGKRADNQDDQFIAQALAGLEALGYKRASAEKMLKAVAEPNLPPDELIRRALRQLMAAKR